MTKRTPKQQARFEAATRRAQRVAQDRHLRLEGERIVKREQEIIDNYLSEIVAYVNSQS